MFRMRYSPTLLKTHQPRSQQNTKQKKSHSSNPSFVSSSSTLLPIFSTPTNLDLLTCTGREDHVGKGYELLRDPSRRDQRCQNSNHSNGSYSIDQIIPRQRCVLPHTLQHTNSLLTAVVFLTERRLVSIASLWSIDPLPSILTRTSTLPPRNLPR